jgi:hypothetical protein
VSGGVGGVTVRHWVVLLVMQVAAKAPGGRSCACSGPPGGMARWMAGDRMVQC